MRIAWLSIVFVVVAVATSFSIPHVAQDYVVGVVVAPMVVAMLCGLALTLRNGGWRAARGWKEFLLFGAAIAEPDKWPRSVSNLVTGRVMLVSATIALGALSGILWTVLVSAA